MINSQTSGQQYTPSMTTLSDGQFLVTWYDEHYGDIKAQRYGADGTPNGGEFTVNSETYGTQSAPKVAALADGGFTVTWYSDYADDGNNHNPGIRARQFDSAGNAVSEARLSGGKADDLIVLADGQIGARIDLGEGTDSLTLGDTRDAVTVTNVETVNLGDGSDSLMVTGVTSVTVNSGAGNDIVYGSTGDDVIRGEAGHDQIVGGGGADTLSGGDGNDQLTGGLGADVLVGGDGNDTYYIRDLEDTIVEEFAGGTDTVFSTLTVTTLGNNIETLYMTGADGVRAEGNALNNTLYGNAGDNTLVGGGGDDTLSGGEGIDVAAYSGNAADYSFNISTMTITDRASADGDDGSDTLVDIETVRFGDGVELVIAGEESGEFRVNTYTSYSQTNPSVAAIGDQGNYVVIWHSQYQDGSGYGVYGQMYNPIDDPIGEEFRVNSYTSSEQQVRSQDAVTGLEDGGFVVTWMDASGHSGGSGWDVRAQRYDDSGTPVGEEVRVNTYTSNSQYNPSVSSLSDGGYVITWEDHGSASHGGTGHDIYGQRFGADGQPAGPNFMINDEVSGNQYEPNVTGLANGRFIVTWRDDDGSSHKDADGVAGSGQDVWARVFNADGSEAIAGFRVNTYTSRSQNDPSVDGFADGSFIITWDSDRQDGSNYGIYGQRYAANGTPDGEEFQINSYTSNHQHNSEVTTLSNGGYVVTWQDNSGSGDSSEGIDGQIYDADNNKVGGEFRVNTYISNTQHLPSIEALVDGGFVVTWSSRYQDGNEYGIYGQRFNADGTPATISKLLGSSVADHLTITGIEDYTVLDLGEDYDSVSLAGTANNTFFVSNTEVVRAGGGDDVVMIRDDLATALYGEAGNDILYGNAADNRVDGGSGRDQLLAAWEGYLIRGRWYGSRQRRIRR